MAKIRRLYSKLNSGMLGPEAVLRSDLDQYYDGAEIMENVLPLTLGGLTRRPAFKYVAGVNGDDEAWMVDFQFNLEQKYLFVFTPGRLDVYSVPDDTLITSLTTSPISNITEAMLPDLKWCQEADTLLLFHADLKTLKITRTSVSTFSATEITLQNVPVHAFSGVTVTQPAATLTPDSVTGSVKLTAGSSVFSAATVKQFIKINDGLVYVQAYDSGSGGTIVTGQVRIELKNTTLAASGDWDLESGYEDVISSSRGWPRSGTFHEDRLWFGGLKQRPQTVLGSRVGEFFDFDEGSLRASDAINATLSTAQLNAIYNIVSGRTLQIFTSGGEFSVPKSDLLDPITPENISFAQQTNHGSTTVRPVGIDGSTIFYDGKDFREFIYNDVERSYVSPSLNLLATTVVNAVVDTDYRRSIAASNASYIFVVNGDGTVAVLNSLRAQNITAWVRWTTEGLIKRVRSVGDDVYFVVERTINGVAKRYIEKLDQNLKLDCGKKATSGSPTNSWSGFTHLGSETVKAFGDDFVIADVDLTTGSGTTDGNYSNVEFGFGFFCRVKAMPFAGVFYGEDVTAKMKRLVKCWLSLGNTRNVLVNGERPPIIDMVDAMDQTPSLYTGLLGVALAGYDRLAQVDITQDESTEFTLYGFATEVGIGS